MRLGNETPLHEGQRVHLREDAGDQTMHLQRRRLVPGCLADDHLLDELPNDRHQAALPILIHSLSCPQHEMPHHQLGTLTANKPHKLRKTPSIPRILPQSARRTPWPAWSVAGLSGFAVICRARNSWKARINASPAVE